MRRRVRPMFETAIRWGFYPIAAIVTLVYLHFELSQPRESIGDHFDVFLIGMLLTTAVTEATFPFRRKWEVKKRKFWRRDLPFLILAGFTSGLAEYLTTSIAVRYSLGQNTVVLEGAAFFGALFLAMLISEFFCYWFHRFEHAARGRIGQFFWRVHVSHHLPEQLNALMHTAGHPLDGIILRVVSTLPVVALGFPPEVVFCANVIGALQVLVSHFNVDMRLGWFNYLLVGNELHRYHHSAKLSEAKNYGSMLSIWDQVFGTFLYRGRGEIPEAIGTEDPSLYPADTQIVRLLVFPFIKRIHRSPLVDHRSAQTARTS